jgi:aspartyl-tRNA(Asn)/glutamyl-tRNA(Gln) amidotransferase subunit B
MVASKKISGRVGKELLERVAGAEGDPAAIVEAEGLGQVDDDAALTAAIEAVLDANPAQVAQYVGGKTSIVGFFVGQVMKQMQGKANPQRTKELVEELLPPVEG